MNIYHKSFPTYRLIHHYKHLVWIFIALKRTLDYYKIILLATTGFLVLYSHSIKIRLNINFFNLTLYDASCWKFNLLAR